MTSAEDALLVRAGILGAACGLTLVALAYGAVSGLSRYVTRRLPGH